VHLDPLAVVQSSAANFSTTVIKDLNTAESPLEKMATTSTSQSAVTAVGSRVESAVKSVSVEASQSDIPVATTIIRVTSSARLATASEPDLELMG
jgi:hypothetical protein